MALRELMVTERLSDKIREYLKPARGRLVNIKDMRVHFKIEPGSKDDQNLRVQMSTTMTKEKLVRPGRFRLWSEGR